MLKTLPNKLTKKMMFDFYKPMPEKLIRSYINHFIDQLGGNIKTKIISDIVLILFIKEIGFPDGYKPSKELEVKLNKVGVKC